MACWGCLLGLLGGAFCCAACWCGSLLLLLLFVAGPLDLIMILLLSYIYPSRVVRGAAAKQRPVGAQAEPGHTQQGARAPADPSAPREEHRVWGGLGVSDNPAGETSVVRAVCVYMQSLSGDERIAVWCSGRRPPPTESAFSGRRRGVLEASAGIPSQEGVDDWQL